MDNIGQGHWVFAGIFVVAFFIAMVIAYRKDFKRVGKQYKRVWLILIGAAIIYACIFTLNRLT